MCLSAREQLEQLLDFKSDRIVLASGVGAKKVLGGVLPEWGVVLTGSVLVLFSAACFAAAVWRELFPAEQARIVQLLVERVDVQEDALEVRVEPRD